MMAWVKIGLMFIACGTVSTVLPAEAVEHASVFDPSESGPNLPKTRTGLARIGATSALRAGQETARGLTSKAGDRLGARVVTRRNQVRNLLGMDPLVRPAVPDPILSHLTEDQRLAIANLEKRGGARSSPSTQPPDETQNGDLRQVLQARVNNLLLNKENYQKKRLPGLLDELKILLKALGKLQLQPQDESDDELDVNELDYNLSILQDLAHLDWMTTSQFMSNANSAGSLANFLQRIQLGLFLSCPDQPELQQAVNELAYKLYEKIFKPSFRKGSFEQKKALAFESLYGAYLKNPIAASRAAAEEMYLNGPRSSDIEIVTDHPAYDVVSGEGGMHVVPRSSVGLSDVQMTKSLQNISELLQLTPVTNDKLSLIKAEIEKLKYNQTIYQQLKNALESRQPLSLNDLQFFAKGAKAKETSFNIALANLAEAIDSAGRATPSNSVKLQEQLKAQVQAFGSTAQQGVQEMETFFNKVGVYSQLEPAIKALNEGISQAIVVANKADGADLFSTVQTFMGTVQSLRTAFEKEYQDSMQNSGVMRALLRYRLQQVVDAEMAKFPVMKLPVQSSDAGDHAGSGGRTQRSEDKQLPDGLPRLDQNQGLSDQEAKLASIGEELVVVADARQKVQSQLAQFQELLEKESFDDATFQQLMSHYDKMQSFIDALPRNLEPLIQAVRNVHQKDKESLKFIDNFSGLVTFMKNSLITYQVLMGRLKEAQRIFNNTNNALLSVQKKIPNMTPPWQIAESLQELSQFSVPGYDSLSRYIDLRATRLLQELHEKGLDEPSVPEPARLAPITKERIDAVGEQIEGIDALVNQISVSGRVDEITSILSQNSLRVSDLESAYALYKALQEEVPNQLDQLQRELKEIWPGTAAAGIGVVGEQIHIQVQEKQKLLEQINRLNQEYNQLLERLKGYNLDAIPEIVGAFKAADDATSSIPRSEALPAPSGLAAKARKAFALYTGKDSSSVPSGPVVNLDALGGLFFWESTSSAMEGMVRTEAQRYLQEASEKSPTRYKSAGLMLEYGRELLGAEKSIGKLLESWSAQKVGEIDNAKEALVRLERLEAQATAVQSSLPKSFMDPFLQRLRTQKNKLKSALFVPEDAIEELSAWKQKFVLKIPELTVKSVDLSKIKSELSTLVKSVEKELVLVKSYPVARANESSFVAALAQVGNQVEEMSKFLKESDIWSKIADLDQAEHLMRTLSVARATVAAGQTLGVANDVDIERDLNFSSAERVLITSLFFKDSIIVSGADFDQAVRMRALGDLEQALIQPGLLTEQQKIYDKLVVDDYKKLEQYRFRVQQLLQTGTSEVIQPFIQELDVFSLALIDKYHDKEIFPSYVKTFKNRMLAALRKERSVLDARVKKLQQKVQDPEPEQPEEQAPNDTRSVSDMDSFATALSAIEEKSELFQEPLPSDLRDMVVRARQSFAAMKSVAGRLVDNTNLIDSVGLASELLQAVQEYEKALPRQIQENSTLTQEIDDVKLLLKYVINRQKMALVVSLQAAYEGFRLNWGTEIYPKMNLAFIERIQRLVAVKNNENVKDPSFVQFLVSLKELLSTSANSSKKFFDALRNEQGVLELEFDSSGYLTAFDRMKNDPDSGVAQAFANHKSDVVRGAMTAVDVQLANLERSYIVAVFDTLTPQEKAELKLHNQALYFAVKAKDLKDRATAYISAIHANFSFDSASITQEKLGRYMSEVHQYRTLCENFYGELQRAQNVANAFKAYELLAPLYARLVDIEAAFKLVEKDKITDRVTFWNRLAYYFSPSYDPYFEPVQETFSDANDQFLKNPAKYLRQQIPLVERKLEGAKVAADELETSVQGLLQKIKNKEVTVQEAQVAFATYKDEFDRLSEISDPYETVYNTYNIIMTTDPAVGSDALMAFERGSNGQALSQGQILTFMARALSIPGSLFIPPAVIMDTPRKLLLDRLIATGKQRDTVVNGEQVKADPRYRDLMFVLDNPLAWDLERMKLEGQKIKINYPQVKKRFEYMQLDSGPRYRIAPTLVNINGLLAQIRTRYRDLIRAPLPEE